MLDVELPVLQVRGLNIGTTSSGRLPCSPAGAVIQFRYEKRYPTQATYTDVEENSAKGQVALIVYIDQAAQERSPGFVPCRYDDNKSVAEPGTTASIEFIVLHAILTDSMFPPETVATSQEIVNPELGGHPGTGSAAGASARTAPTEPLSTCSPTTFPTARAWRPLMPPPATACALPTSANMC